MAMKFSIWLVRSLITLLIAALIFSTISLDFTTLVTGVFGDIYDYSSSAEREKVVGELYNACSALDRGALVTVMQLCSNKTLMDKVEQNCREYRDLRKIQAVDNDARLDETCTMIESGEIKRNCDSAKTNSPDLGDVAGLCQRYNNNEINSKEFFVGILSSPLGNQQMEVPKIGILEKYNKLIRSINSNKLISWVVMLTLIVLLYILLKDLRLFVKEFTGIFFSAGIILMFPYLVIVLYGSFVGIDTTQILGFLLGSEDVLGPKPIISVMLLMFKRTYTSSIIFTGITFLLVGIGGKIFYYATRSRAAKTS